MQPKNQKQKIK